MQTLHPFDTTVLVVEPGTVVTCPKTGRKEIVDDTHGVAMSGTIYVTKKTFEALKAHPSVREATQEERDQRTAEKARTFFDRYGNRSARFGFNSWGRR